ncbi:MAG: ribonuclease R [Malacoplasma sp.]|nr:ribonuclease R [Malacoplasma sp.]
MYKRENNSLSPLEKKILDFIKNDNRPIPLQILVKKIDYFNKKAIISATNYLIDNNYLEKLNNGKIVLGYTNGPLLENEVFEGTIILNSKGDGFFKLNDQKESFAYVNKKNLNSALNGDSVLICLMDKKPTYDDLKDAVILKIVERNRDFFTGTYFVKKDMNGNKVEEVKPDDQKIISKIIVNDFEDKLVNGSKVLFKIANVTNQVIYCEPWKVLGHVDDVGTDIISIVYDKGIEPNFSDEANKETESINFNFSDTEDKKRTDLSHINFVTIDPPTSKDMDDAICVIKNKDGSYKLYVAIADVSYYVKLHSKLWSTILERGTSIYLVNQVIPMLPHKLSNNICSLNPYEKRYAQICEMDIDKNGNFLNIKVYSGIINSKHKFAYDDVNLYFDTKQKKEGVNSEIYQMIDTCAELDKYLSAKHEKEGYIDFEILEPKIILDEKEKIKEIVVKESGKAQKMIENFMVAANEAVTIKFNESNPPSNFVYRVHDRPDEVKVEAFKIEAKKIGFIFDNSVKEWKPDTISKWLKNNKNNPNKELINMILLRTMAKAKYQTHNIGHFGLSIKYYTHFTSPIRRLADVIVHYLLKMFVHEKNNFTSQEKDYLLQNLDTFCEIANKTEIVAVETEREVNAMKFAEYMEQKVGNTYNGFVSYITSFGIFVQLENTIEGLVKPMNIKDDFYVFDKDNWYL